MIVPRKKEQKLEEQKLPTFKWNELAGDLQFHVAIFLNLNDGISFQRASKASVILMYEIWQRQFEPQIEKYFSFDVPRLKRMKKGNINFLAEYKNCDNRYNKRDSDFAIASKNSNLEEASIDFLNLFKEGKLEEIINYQVTLQEIFDKGDYQGLSLIQWAAKYGHQHILDCYFGEAIEQYPENSDVNHCTGLYNATRLFWAACLNNVDKVGELFEEKEININAVTSCGETALHAAAYMGNIEIVNQLITANASVNIQDTRGHTPCYEAAHFGFPEVVTLLLNAHADINNLVQNHPLPSWIWQGNGNTALIKAAQKGNYEVVKILVKFGANVNQRTDNGESALWRAVENRHHEIIPLLIEAKAEVNVVDYTSIGNSLVHVAVDRRDISAAKFLIENKADVNVINSSGYTPLPCAALRGDKSIVTLLLQAGATWPYNSFMHSDGWPITYVFDPHTKLKPEIKKMLVIAELNQKLSKIQPEDSGMLSSVIGLFSVRYRDALLQLKSAVESNAGLETFQSIKRWHPVVFLSEEYNDIYNRACSIVNPASVECIRQCSKRSKV